MIGLCRKATLALGLVGLLWTGSADRQDLTIGGLSADVTVLVEHLDLGEVVLIGNSLGGPVPLEEEVIRPGSQGAVVPFPVRSPRGLAAGRGTGWKSARDSE